jgi:4-nitrophenyl phosphatase
VVLGFDSTLDYTKLRTAIRAALAGAAIIATNPDVLTPVHDGYDPCVGVLTSRAQPPMEEAAELSAQGLGF